MAEGGPEVEMPPMPELAEFVLPVMQGSVHQMSDLRFQTPMADYNGSITLIARRSATRPGVRHWRRGIAPDVRITPSTYFQPCRVNDLHTWQNFSWVTPNAGAKSQCSSA